MSILYICPKAETHFKEALNNGLLIDLMKIAQEQDCLMCAAP